MMNSLLNPQRTMMAGMLSGKMSGAQTGGQSPVSSGEMAAEMDGAGGGPMALVGASLVGASEEKIAAAVEAAGKRHEQWEAQFVTLGRQESELFSAQWKMVREELGVLTRDLATAQCQLEEMKISSKQAAMHMKMSASGNDGKLEEERALRRKFEEDMKQEMRNLREDLQREAKQREAGDANTLTEAMSKIEDPAAAMLQVKSKDLPMIQQSLGDLRTAVGRVPVQLDSLRDAVKAEARSRELGHESMVKSMDRHREALSKDLRLAQQGLDSHKKELPNLWSAIQQEKSDRDVALAPLQERLGGVERGLEPHAQEVPALRRLCEDIKSGLGPKQSAQQKAMDEMADGLRASQAQLEKGLADLSAKIDREGASRAAFADDMEQSMAPLKSKLRNLEAGQAEHSRQREVLERSLKEQLSNVAAARDGQLQALQNELSTHKESLGERMDDMRRNHKDLEQRVKEAPREMPSFEQAPTPRGFEQAPTPRGMSMLSPRGRRTEDLARQVRDLQGRVPKEGVVSETIVYPHEDHISFLEESLQDFCERFIGGLQRRRDSLQPRSLVVQRQEFSGDQDKEFQAKDAAIPTITEGHDAHDEEAEEVQKTVSAPESPERTSVADWKDLQLPEVSAEKEQDLHKIFSGGRVKLVANKDKSSNADHEAKLVLTEQIEFKKVHHGDSPVAHFKDEDAATKALSDIVGVLRAFDQATMVIEGHTATPPDKMDQWAHDLAFNRAEKVKKAIISLGIEAGRLQSVGMPGHLGSGKVDTVFKLSSVSDLPF